MSWCIHCSVVSFYVGLMFSRMFTLSFVNGWTRIGRYLFVYELSGFDDHVVMFDLVSVDRYSIVSDRGIHQG